MVALSTTAFSRSRNLAKGPLARRTEDELDFTWNQLSVLPKRWKTKLSEWRRIYYIFDRSDGEGCVGSAYGSEDLLGRWRNYANSGHGGNRFLRERNAQNFHFTILELAAPTMDADEVIRRENTAPVKSANAQTYFSDRLLGVLISARDPIKSENCHQWNMVNGHLGQQQSKTQSDFRQRSPNPVAIEQALPRRRARAGYPAHRGRVPWRS
jgi:hypothetical protein